MSASAVEAARERAMAFVEARGDALARARAAALAEPRARDAVLARLPAPDAPRPALAALAVLAALGVDRGEAVARAVETLAAAQRPDGSWTGDDPVVATAVVAAALARTAAVRPVVLRRAGDFLAAHWAPERIAGGDVRAVAGFAAFFANAPHELGDAALQWCGRELERGFRAGLFSALDVAGVLVSCDAAGLPGARLVAPEVIDALLAGQAPDGGFGPPGAAEPDRVEATLSALAALHRLAPRARG